MSNGATLRVRSPVTGFRSMISEPSPLLPTLITDAWKIY
jgi:hypothetical protein